MWRRRGGAGAGGGQRPGCRAAETAAVCQAVPQAVPRRYLQFLILLVRHVSHLLGVALGLVAGALRWEKKVSAGAKRGL